MSFIVDALGISLIVFVAISHIAFFVIWALFLYK